MPVPPPPFAPAPIAFPLTRLAAQTARAALGGPREVLMGTLVVARLAYAFLPPYPLPGDVRRLRADGVRSWLTALAVASKTRAALQSCIDATAQDDVAAVIRGVHGVVEHATPHLDRGARSELDRLIAALRTLEPATTATSAPPT